MDDVVARTEADPSFHFTLDGQLAVVDDYLAARIAEAEQIGTGVRDRAVDAVAATVPARAVPAFNPTPALRTDVVPVELAAPHEWDEVQRVEITGEAELTVTMGRGGPGFTEAFRSLSKALYGTEKAWRLVVKEEPLRVGFAAIPVGPLGFRAAERSRRGRASGTRWWPEPAASATACSRSR